jgi:hypothetical protein
MTGGTQVLPLWTRMVKEWSTRGSGDYFLSHSTPLHIRVIRQSYIDCWHLVEGVGSKNSSISRCNFNESLVENLPPPEKIQKGSGISQVFACNMSSVILTDILQTVLETSECLLSNNNNTMHILATETEELAVYNGHLFIQATQCCPCSHKKLLFSGYRWRHVCWHHTMHSVCHVSIWQTKDVIPRECSLDWLIVLSRQLWTRKNTRKNHDVKVLELEFRIGWPFPKLFSSSQLSSTRHQIVTLVPQGCQLRPPFPGVHF